ncbi:hypothetical protein DKX38_000183 [Salix brachista]|uniref:Uncharacterized protein n=1 Tax=Salix brachista TaxID=2182728 RepID=A0A5N5P0Q1_9ROSI|nr:hypothetical protein DKX38_000183 [Salix brachista]
MTAFRYEGDEINARLADSEADILHDAMATCQEINCLQLKFGTGEDALTRVIVTRAEKDLNDIKELISARKGGLNFVLLLAFQCFQSQFNNDLCSTFFLRSHAMKQGSTEKMNSKARLQH